MIKKIFLLAVLFAAAAMPKALANDASFYSGDSAFGIKIIPSSYHIAIGEEYTFTAEITNYTGEAFDWVRLLQDYFISYEEYIDIKPYQTVQIDITVNAGETINWYADGNKQYAILQPEVCVKTEDTYIYYVKTPGQITLEIDNIEDGIEYLTYEFADSKKYVTYQCREIWPEIGQYQYYGLIFNEMIIKNVSDKIIEDINIKGRYGYLYEIDIEPDSQAEVSTQFNDTTGLYDLPGRVNAYHNLLFEMDGKYYGVTAAKNYLALYYNLPLIKLELKGTKNEDGYFVNTTMKLTNTSASSINNFFVDFTGLGIYMPDYLFPTIQAGETIEMDIPVYDYKWMPGEYTYGYYIEDDNMLIGWSTYYVYYVEKYENNDEYKMWSDYLGNNLYNYDLQLEYHHDEVEVLVMLTATSQPIPTPEITATPEPTPASNETPSPTDIPAPVDTAAAATSALASPTEDMSVKNVDVKQMPYIPLWVWIALGTTASALLVLLFGKKIFKISKKQP